MLNVALFGLGIMGGGMAHNLLRAQFPLAVYNRTVAKAAPLEAAGAKVAETPADAVAGADVVFAMVGDDAASRAVWLGDGGALAAVQQGTILVECSTLSLEWVRELAQAVAARGCTLLDAPVTGSKDAAAAGELVLFVGGDKAAYERALPALEAISRHSALLGPNGAGATMKLVNNLMGAVQAVALAEGLLLAERAGLDMEQALPLILNGAPGSPLVKGKAARMVARDYDETHFALRWMGKDAAYALRAAQEYGVPMPTVAAAWAVYQQAQGQGLGEKDFAAVIEALRRAE